MKQLDIKTFRLYQGKDPEKVQLFIRVEKLSLAEAEKKLTTISELLSKHMTKRWKLLPSSKLPESYNIATLPYQIL